MSGHRGRQVANPGREIFLTSSSLSFSTLSSSTSWDDAIELNTKESRTSCEEHEGKLSKASSRCSGMSGVTHVRTQVQLRNNKGLGPHYDPERIPASVFGKTGDLNWSEISNESLFSLRMSNCQAFRRSNLKPEEVLMSGEYSPSLLVKPEEDAKEKRSEVKEVKTNSHQEKSSSTPVVSRSTNPSSFYQLYQAPPTKVQSFSPSCPVGEKKSKKRKKTRKSKKTKKKNKCCIWSWLFSGFSKCECNLCCYKWRKFGCCCRGPKAISHHESCVDI